MFYQFILIYTYVEYGWMNKSMCWMANLNGKKRERDIIYCNSIFFSVLTKYACTCACICSMRCSTCKCTYVSAKVYVFGCKNNRWKWTGLLSVRYEICANWLYATWTPPVTNPICYILFICIFSLFCQLNRLNYERCVCV